MLKVAITRAAPEALRTAERVRAMGAAPVLAPLLTIQPLAFKANLDSVQACLFTSANGVRAFAAIEARRDVKILCVGEATAEAARTEGFGDVSCSDGDSHALAQATIAALDPAKGSVLHVSGAHVAGDLVGTLQNAGFQATRQIAYEANAAHEIPAALLQPVDLILFHSARAAETFAALGAPGAARLTAVCLSSAVADAARGGSAASVSWNKIIVAPRPREDALLTAALAP